MDAQGRQELALWDVSACWASAAAVAVCGTGSSGAASSGAPAAARPRELARQASDYNVQCLRFVPWGEPGRLVACGKNSVRLYRPRDGALRGLSVPFDGVEAPRRRPGSCGTLAGGGVGEVFTCLGFEARAAPPAQPHRLYVGALSGEWLPLLHPRKAAVHAAPVSLCSNPSGLSVPTSFSVHNGATAGAVYAIDVGGEARSVERVAQLHDAPLTALAVRADGGLATGCADGLLRLWGPDLARPYLEAQHEGPVTGACAVRLEGPGAGLGAGRCLPIGRCAPLNRHGLRPPCHTLCPAPAGIAQSPEGLRLAVGTRSGAQSLLDLPAQRYTTLLRSHTAAVQAVALLGQPPPASGGGGQGPLQYCTAGADGTVRVWDAATHQQALELTAPGETVLRCGAGIRALVPRAAGGHAGASDGRRSAEAACRSLPAIPAAWHATRTRWTWPAVFRAARCACLTQAARSWCRRAGSTRGR